ncbi:glycosyltransferase family 4 protein [Bacteroidia bacterium]|nr:glycosyltransferase family 4 protein [Bacteroidia bacterium]MDB9881617.1 glycosyltransferase family 4 protein [Bacteroidia bacterium]MDC1395075.1 glycosyltransferase family 4 protein [Bacteroidia bacterium]
MKKIALLYINTGTGGSSEVMKQTAIHLAKTYQVTIISHQALKDYFKTDQILFKGVYSEYYDKGFIFRLFRFLTRHWLGPNWLTTKRLKRLFSKTEYDLIHFHSALALSLYNPNWSLKAKTVFTDHDSIYNIQKKHHFLIDLNYSSFVENLRTVNLITSPSTNSISEIKNHNKNTNTQYKVVRNGCTYPMRTISKDFKSIRAIFPGGSNPVKRLNTLIYHLEQIDLNFLKEINFKLVVLGTTELYVSSYVKQSHLNPFLEFKGHLIGKDYMNELEAANVYINNSVSEVLPLALLESLAYQLVPLVKRVGGIPEIIQNNTNGLLYKDSNFAEVFYKLRDFKLLEKISKVNEDLAKGFSWQKISLEYDNCYTKIL